MIKSITILGSVGLFLSSHAYAADHEASIAIGSFTNTDNQYSLYSNNDNMVSWGLRGGYAVHKRLSVIGTYHHHQTGAEVYSNAEDQYTSHFVAAYSSDIFGIGVKADVEPWKVLQCYVSAQGLLYRANIKLDEDANSRTNAGQIKASGISAGAQVMGGLELKIHMKTLPFHIGWYTEFGYGVIAKHGYKGVKDVNSETNGFEDGTTMTTMSPSGLVIRSGLGIRF